jgi:hypothetical protein
LERLLDLSSPEFLPRINTRDLAPPPLLIQQEESAEQVLNRWIESQKQRHADDAAGKIKIEDSAVDLKTIPSVVGATVGGQSEAAVAIKADFADESQDKKRKDSSRGLGRCPTRRSHPRPGIPSLKPRRSLLLYLLQTPFLQWREPVHIRITGTWVGSLPTSSTFKPNPYIVTPKQNPAHRRVVRK